jgi:hypothetical protein
MLARLPLLLLTSLALGGCLRERAPEVDIGEILAHPEKYVGKRVSLLAYYDAPRNQLGDARDFKHPITLDASPRGHGPLDSGFVRVVGTVTCSGCGTDRYSLGLDNVTTFHHPWFYHR